MVAMQIAIPIGMGLRVRHLGGRVVVATGSPPRV
jgi:hypothetical protein